MMAARWQAFSLSSLRAHWLIGRAGMADDYDILASLFTDIAGNIQFFKSNIRNSEGGTY